MAAIVDAKGVRAILDRIEAEEAARFAQRQAFHEIRRVIEVYDTIVQEIPRLEAHRKQMVDDNAAVAERLKNEVSLLARRAKEEREAYEKLVKEMHAKRNEAQGVIAELDKLVEIKHKEADKAIAAGEALVKAVVDQLTKAQADYEQFKQRHLANA